jgi:hypothetical protein
MSAGQMRPLAWEHSTCRVWSATSEMRRVRGVWATLCRHTAGTRCGSSSIVSTSTSLPAKRVLPTAMRAQPRKQRSTTAMRVFAKCAPFGGACARIPVKHPMPVRVSNSVAWNLDWQQLGRAASKSATRSTPVFGSSGHSSTFELDARFHRSSGRRAPRNVPPLTRAPQAAQLTAVPHADIALQPFHGGDSSIVHMPCRSIAPQPRYRGKACGRRCAYSLYRFASMPKDGSCEAITRDEKTSLLVA